MDCSLINNIDDNDHEEYVPPAQKSIEEMVAADQDDESLRRYKETLLGTAQVEKIVFDASNPKSVIVKKLSLLVDSRPEKQLDLSDVASLKKQVITIKEGVNYKVKIDFVVQREIVHGLKYVQKIYRIGVPVDKMVHMLGSYPPKKNIQSYTTPSEEAPAGIMARGTYTIVSLFTDDDKNEHLKWEWTFEIKKNW